MYRVKKALLQSVHRNGFSSLCTVRCLFRVDLNLKALSQSVHWNGLSPVCTLFSFLLTRPAGASVAVSAQSFPSGLLSMTLVSVPVPRSSNESSLRRPLRPVPSSQPWTLLLRSRSETGRCILSPAYSYRLDVKQGYILVFFAYHRNITFLDKGPFRK